MTRAELNKQKYLIPKKDYDDLITNNWAGALTTQVSKLKADQQEQCLTKSLENLKMNQQTNKPTKKHNKAGYTGTSCGLVGRSKNMLCHIFRLMLTDEPTDGRTDEQSLL